MNPYTMFPQNGGTRVIAKGFIRAMMPFGQINKEEAKDSNTFKEIQTNLNEIKQEAEGR